jgi:hypothetical protein
MLGSSVRRLSLNLQTCDSLSIRSFINIGFVADTSAVLIVFPIVWLLKSGVPVDGLGGHVISACGGDRYKGSSGSCYNGRGCDRGLAGRRGLRDQGCLSCRGDSRGGRTCGNSRASSRDTRRSPGRDRRRSLDVSLVTGSDCKDRHCDGGLS